MILVVGRAQTVQQLAHLAGQHAEITGVEPDRAEPAAGQFDAELHRREDVIGVHEQRGVVPERGELGR